HRTHPAEVGVSQRCAAADRAAAAARRSRTRCRRSASGCVSRRSSGMSRVMKRSVATDASQAEGAPQAAAAQPIEPLDEARVRADFPILGRLINGRRLVYLDSAASSQRPLAVLRAVEHYERDLHSNVHRGVHSLSQWATEAYEGARETVRGFINARSVREIIFVRGTTEAINLV